MKYDCKEDIIQLSPLWEGERFDDGRPKVPDDVLRRVAGTTIEEMWAPLFVRGYKYQFEGGFKRSNHDKRVLVGRAVTAVFMPTRPDLANCLMDYAHNVEGRPGNFNQWPLEHLKKDDVVVLDMYDKVREGCTLGGNLSTLIANRTEGCGAVVWGGMRDLAQVEEIKSAQFYYRDADPTPFLDAVLIGINVPCSIGMAVCMPGDVVFGTRAGVIFIPAHLAETCVIDAEKSHARDIWGFMRLNEGKYTAAQIDTAWERAMWEDFYIWFQEASEAAPYRHLNFDRELQDARDGVVRTFEDEMNEGQRLSQPMTRW
jgi:regulator of RNase E activity RraA